MARKFLTAIDLAKNELQNAKLQNLASDPSSPVLGQMYFNTTDNKIRTWNGSTWDEYGTGAGSGDVSSNTSSSVDSEVVLFNGTTGKSVKRATITGLAKLASGVLSAATQGTDYYAPSGTDVAVADGGTGASTLTGVLKGNGTSAVTGSATLTDVGSPTADFSIGSHKLTNVADPSSAQDAATKAYVDAAAAGIDWKASVRAIATTNGTLGTAYANSQVVDGVTLATGNRILLAGQTTGADNGIYTVNASGAPTRATDADANAEVTGGLAVFAEEGTTNADTGWVLTNNGAITVGTTALTFTQFTGLGEVTTGHGLSKTGNTISMNAPFTATIGDGSSTSIAVTHSLSNQYVLAQAFDASTNAKLECDITLTSSSQTTFGFVVAPSTNAIRVVIFG